jgi:hypothetical protein
VTLIKNKLQTKCEQNPVCGLATKNLTNENEKEIDVKPFTAITLVCI